MVMGRLWYALPLSTIYRRPPLAIVGPRVARDRARDLYIHSNGISVVYETL